MGTDNTDHHKYYNSTFTSFNGSWIDLEEWNKTIHPGIVFEHPMLSKSYRRAATIPLKFDFPFYGHDVRNITIATGGFLYTGDYVHSWLAATQYIAPLMANFDTSSSPNSKIRYADNGKIDQCLKMYFQCSPLMVNNWRIKYYHYRPT